MPPARRTLPSFGHDGCFMFGVQVSVLHSAATIAIAPAMVAFGYLGVVRVLC